jgi:hypothetical protein
MYFNSFSQEMADRFVKEHLMNPAEFFTYFPLPSIAAYDAAFKNNETNDWSGQPEGLTYQRAIRALENYGYLSELSIFGLKLLKKVGSRNIFGQQWDPFSGTFSDSDHDTNYGPTALAVLEYISRLFGIHVQFDEVYWGVHGLGEISASYSQLWDGDTYKVALKGGIGVGSLNGKELFAVSTGVRVVTDWSGKVKRIICIAERRVSVRYRINKQWKTVVLEPNQVMTFD